MEIEELINQMEPFNIKTILEDLSTYQTRIAKLEATNLSLERGISFLGDLHDALRTQLNFSNATITELRGQLEKMAAERDSLKQQLAAEQARAEGLRRNSMYAVQQVRELEAQLAAEQDKALPAWFRIQGLCSMTAVADEIITLEQQLAAAQERERTLRDALDNMVRQFACTANGKRSTGGRQ